MGELLIWLDRERVELLELAGEFSSYVSEFFESRADHRSDGVANLEFRVAVPTTSGDFATSA
jgi:hypothetical protein